MKPKPRVDDVMTPDPDTVQVGQSLSEAYALLQDRSFHHVPVVDGSKPVGMISASDILRLVYDVDGTDDRMVRSFIDHQFTLQDAMSTDLLTVHRDDPLRKATTHMSGGDVHSVLVLDDEGCLDGIVTSTDLIRTLGDLVQ